MKNKLRNLLLIVLIGFVVSCSPGSNQMSGIENSQGELAGFFLGLWHGFTLLFTFIVSLFKSEVNVYEVHNVGALYNLGYLLGVSIFFSGSGKASSSRKK